MTISNTGRHTSQLKCAVLRRKTLASYRTLTLVNTQILQYYSALDFWTILSVRVVHCVFTDLSVWTSFTRLCTQNVVCSTDVCNLETYSVRLLSHQIQHCDKSSVEWFDRQLLCDADCGDQKVEPGSTADPSSPSREGHVCSLKVIRWWSCTTGGLLKMNRKWSIGFDADAATLSDIIESWVCMFLNVLHCTISLLKANSKQIFTPTPSYHCQTWKQTQKCPAEVIYTLIPTSDEWLIWMNATGTDGFSWLLFFMLSPSASLCSYPTSPFSSLFVHCHFFQTVEIFHFLKSCSPTAEQQRLSDVCCWLCWGQLTNGLCCRGKQTNTFQTGKCLSHIKLSMLSLSCSYSYANKIHNAIQVLCCVMSNSFKINFILLRK